jgi:hypothetical protein
MYRREKEFRAWPLFRNIGTSLPCPICFLPPTSVGGLVGDLALFGT